MHRHRSPDIGDTRPAPLVLSDEEQIILEALRDCSPVFATLWDLGRRLPALFPDEIRRGVDNLVRHRLVTWWNTRGGSHVLLTSFGAERMGVVMVGTLERSRWEPAVPVRPSPRRSRSKIA